MVLQGKGYQDSRLALMEALADYVDARIDYRLADPEYRSSREVSLAAGQLEAALDELFKHT